MTRMTTTTTLRRDDLIVEEGPGGFGSHYGIVLQTGDVVFDVLWLDGNSTTRYRHAWGRHIRAISEAELRGARAYREYDPVADLRDRKSVV